MILVTGASGHFGKATIGFLLNKGLPAAGIGALVRDESKATDLIEKGVELRKGDYEDYDSLVKAFTGVEKLVLVSSSDISNRIGQQANAVKAAKEAGVKYILYTSFVRKDETDASPIAWVAKSHINTEKLIPVFIGEKALETGIYWPAGDTPGAYALRAEMAEAAANVLTSSDHVNKEYNLSNTSAWTFQQVADTISSASGKTIGYISPAQDEYKSVLTQAGVPELYVNMFAGFAEAIRIGEFDSTADTDLEKLLGRKPTSLEQYLTAVYGK
jgi:NAD(P)H dehydrogenase (quinone)